jgi:hypothetical protein
VFEVPEALRRRLFGGGCDDQDGGVFTRLVTTVKSQLPVVPQSLQQVRNVLWHGTGSVNSARTDNLTHRNENCKHVKPEFLDSGVKPP